MYRFWAHFSYTTRHKWYVMLECWKRGLYWRGLKHDLSKYTLREFFPYAYHFFDENGERYNRVGKPGYSTTEKTGDLDFEKAWFWHQARNDHHWQYWVVPGSDGSFTVMDMDEICIIEMYCDWVGAGIAANSGGPKEWYDNNKNKLLLSPRTRERIEYYIETKGGLNREGEK